VHRWTVGEVEVVRVEDDDFALPSVGPVPAWAVEAGLAPSATETALAFTAYGIHSRDTRIVVDPWIANDFPRTQPDADERSTSLLDDLAAEGFPAARVDVAVLTHVDGRGWFTRPDGSVAFANARHLIARDEDAAVRRGDPLFGPEPFRDLLDAIGAEPVDPPLDLTDEVTLAPAPGHNFGHLAVRIESGGELAVLPGHLFLTVFEVADPSLAQGEFFVPDLESTRREVLDELVDRRGLLLLPLVGGPAGGAGVVERDGDGYRLVSPRPRTP
jgi:glyoxylase-like metal-dependent hydrolase (beta-lactamase superfamily II)